MFAATARESARPSTRLKVLSQMSCRISVPYLSVDCPESLNHRSPAFPFKGTAFYSHFVRLRLKP
jgi:hypothetical protein